MKRITIFYTCILLVLVFFPVLLSAQAADTTKTEKQDTKVKKGYFLIGAGNDILQNVPAGIEQRNYSPSFMFSMNLNKPLVKGRFLNFSVGSGIGLQSNNLHSNARISKNNEGQTVFTPIPENTSYSKNKLTLTYAEIPVELQLTLGEKYSFTIAAGFKAGYLISSHMKFKGENYLNNSISLGSERVKIKEYHIPNVKKLRYTATGRISYKFISAFVHYNLTPVFEEDKLKGNNGEISNMELITAGLLMDFSFFR